MENNIAQMLPNDIDAERSVLGSILLEQNCIAIVYERIKQKDYFYRPNHQEIYDTMCVLYNAGTPIDLVTLMSELVRRGSLEAIGGAGYLTDLTAMVPSVANVSHYVDIVVEKYKLRRLISVSSETSSDSYAGELESKEIIERAERNIFNIALNNEISKLEHVQNLLPDAYERIDLLYRSRGEILGVPTGFTALDDMLSGMQPANLIIIAARPSMGKTSLVLNIAAHAAMVKKMPVAFFSLEMSHREVVMRLISTEGSVDAEKIRKGDLNEDDWENISRAMTLLENSNLYIDDTAGIGVAEIRSKCRRIKDLQLVIIDYLTLMSTDSKNENRQQEVSELSRQLKGLARALNVPVIVLSQLSRAPSSRSDHRPLLSDLRESGAIEQDADVVMFIHRPAYYPDSEEQDASLAEIIVAKQRNGPVGKVELIWKPEYTRFMNKSFRE